MSPPHKSGSRARGVKFTNIQEFFFFNDTATTEIYTLSLHDALPIYTISLDQTAAVTEGMREIVQTLVIAIRSEEHTSELQSQSNLVCRLLLEKKKAERMQIEFAGDGQRHGRVGINLLAITVHVAGGP